MHTRETLYYYRPELPEINHKAFYTSNLYVLRFVSIFTDRFIERSIIVNLALTGNPLWGPPFFPFLRSLIRRRFGNSGGIEWETQHFPQFFFSSLFTCRGTYIIIIITSRSFISHYEKFPLHGTRVLLTI